MSNCPRVAPETRRTPRRLNAGLRRLAGASLLLFLAASSAEAIVYTYENTTTGSIPELTTDALCNGGTALVRTFTVPDSFTVATISLGINLTHADRGHIRAILNAPGGSSAVFLTQTAAAGDDPDDNYDVYISTHTDGAGTNPQDDGSTDPTAEPFYHRLVNLASNFYTGNAAGTWTLRVCDRHSAGGLGTFNRARLVLTSAVNFTPACTSRTTFTWCPGCSPSPPAAATSTAFPGAGITAGGVTITQSSTTLSDATASTRNFNVVNTQTGGEFGFFAIEWNATAAQVELVRSEATFAMSVPVRDLQWKLMDQDNSSWEDYIRVRGFFGGSEVRYSTTTSAAPSYQFVGEILEADTNSAPADTFGNHFWDFEGAVSSVRSEYWSGDDFADPAQQFVGFGTALYCAFDYGDAPSTYGTATARHTMANDTLHLGVRPGDGETAGSPGATATGDDVASPAGGSDDEDGVPTPFPAMTAGAGGTYTVTGITVRNTTGATATLCGWVDFDINGGAQDGSFESDEGSCITVPASGNNANCTESPTGTFTCSMSWTVPADFVRTGSSTYARFRVTPASAGMTTASFSSAIDQPGEVEDYEIAAGTLPVTVAMVESERSGDDLTLRWTTASEAGNAGFRVWGQTARGGQELLGTYLSQKTDSFAPQYYEATLPGRGISAVLIEDVSIFGESRVHGPFAVGKRFGEEVAERSIDWAAVRAETATGSGRAGGAPAIREAARPLPGSVRGALLSVREKGIHRVTHEQLLAAGVDLGGVAANRIALENSGRAYPRHVHAPAGTFGPGAYVEFYFAPELTLHSPFDALVLRESRSRVSPAAVVTPRGGTSAVLRAELAIEEENAYSFGAPNGDPWFEAQILAWGGPDEYVRTFDLPGLAGGPVKIDLRGWGYGAFDGAEPDHHVVVELNGVEVANRRFDGVTPLALSFQADGIVAERGNQLTIRVPGDVPYPFDNLAYDGITVSYPRHSIAHDGRFSAVVTDPAPVAIGGFAEGEPVALWRIVGERHERALASVSGGAVSLAGGGEIHAANAAGILSPSIRSGVPTALYASRADYLIVTHPALAGALDDLVALEEARGLATEVVTVDRIYAAYGDHAPSAAAIRQFIAGSLDLGTRYVLLAGSDTSDPYDHLGLGSVSYVPTDYVSLPPVVAFSPTDETYVDADGDGVGDVPIGRLPARTPAELQAMVDKIVQWEGAVGQGLSALLVSGASDGAGGSLSRLNDSFHGALAGRDASVAAVDTLGSAAVRAAVLAALDGGTKLVSYVGHSAMGQWDWTPLLKWQDVENLTNAGAPNLITAWGCWNSYFVEPNIESLAARLLRESGAGAAAAIGATTLTSEGSHQALGELFFAQLAGGAIRVGDALQAAKQALAARGGGDDAILGMTLLGDPAMSLPVD